MSSMTQPAGQTSHISARPKIRTNASMLVNTAIGCLRVALAVGFLSAVADRFGVWGPPGAANVAWGDWEHFVEYVALLNWFVPQSAIPTLAWAATIAEFVVAVGLLTGWQLRWIALAGGVLLSSFAITMVMALGVKAPLDYSVFGVAASAFLIAAMPEWRERARR